MKRIFFMLAVLTNYASSQMSSEHSFNGAKTMDIDLSTCIDNFDIHKDKIIRTQDSQKMGAKYLNAIDLGSRQECLRLCCETDDCDVFVYEDKNSGSCYLFHCGPPEDFKCKFTHHVNYSSAVLAINRHLPDLESQIKLTKHEKDLTKLRKSENESEPAPHILEDKTQISATSSTTVKTKENPPDPKETFSEKKCSRYQFECRSTRECIAIYNACDGIPQCADGSDEAPELGCPEVSTISAIPAQRVNNVPAVTNFEKNIISAKGQDVLHGDVYHIPPPRAEIIPDEQMVLSNNPDFLRAVSQERQLPGKLPQYPNQPEFNPQRQQMGWNSHQPNSISYQMPPNYPGKTSHIFSHNDNGLQVPEPDISSYTNSLNYPKVSNYYIDNYRGNAEATNWVNAHQDDSKYPVKYKEDPYYDINNRPASNKFENPEHIQIKMAHELQNSKDVHMQESEKNTKIRIVEAPTEVKKDNYPDVVAYKMDGHDGVAQTPGGAVLSLTFGLIITCIMAVMIACRLRIVKRRTRKGGKGYAHDADYLVNGMYL